MIWTKTNKQNSRTSIKVAFEAIASSSGDIQTWLIRVSLDKVEVEIKVTFFLSVTKPVQWSFCNPSCLNFHLAIPIFRAVRIILGWVGYHRDYQFLSAEAGISSQRRPNAGGYSDSLSLSSPSAGPTKSSGANGRTHCKCKLSSWDHFAWFGRPALLMTAINNSFGKSFCTNMIFLTAEQSARTDAFSELSFMLLVHLYASIISFSGYFWGKICEWQERMDSWTLDYPPPPVGIPSKDFEWRCSSKLSKLLQIFSRLQREQS